MTKTIEFVEKEIKNIKELFELDDVLCLKTDEDYKFWYNRLQILEQIKCELEAWEELNKIFEIGVEEQIDEIYIKGKNYYGNEKVIWGYSKDGTLKVKKALEEKNE